MNELVWWFGQNTLAALLMIPCVMLACRLFRDRPAVQHLLWLVILLKFVTPPVVVWPWSVDALQSMAWSQLSVQQESHQGASLDPTPAATMPQLNEPRSVSIESAVVPQVPVPSSELSSLPANVLILTDNANEKAHPTTSTNWYPIVARTAILAWFIGAIGCAFTQLRRLARYARLVRSGEVAPPHLKAEVASVASLLSMKAPVCVIVEGIVSPFLWCAGSARLAWPDSLSSQADVVRSRGIIAHELAHLRRRDHWITWLELGASILWWWNPLFWYVRRQLRETAEMSCDALAIAANPESRSDYAELLLLLSSQSTNSVPVPVIAMGASNVASFEKRLKMILSSNVSGSLSWRGAVAIALLAVIALPYWSLAQSTNLEPSPTLTEQSNTAKEPRKATEPDYDNDSIVVGEKPDTSANKVPSSTHQFIAAKPKHVNFVSSGTSEILNDRSVQLNPTDQWQEYALHFSPADLPSKVSVVQLEILPRDSAQSSNSKPAMLIDVKPHLKGRDGQTIHLDFAKCTFTGDVNDDLTVNCIDYLSDTGWQVPEFTDNHRVHHLLLHLEKPVEMENVTDFALTIDAGGAGQFSAVSRVRVSFADATSHLPAQDETRRPGTRRTITVKGQLFSFRWCPPGEFLMGSPEDKRSQYGGSFVPQHHVRISRGFWLSESETTQAQYEMVTGENPSFWKPLHRSSTGAIEDEHTADNPVEQVSWFDASSFCQELTKLVPQHRFRLPTEAEWEYACRVGQQECRHGEINDIAWVFENTEIGTEGSFGHRKAGSKAPNAWGLHDMLGNVSEWCSDWSGPPATQPTIDPTGPNSGEYRIARGGNCFADPGGLRSDGACMAGTRDQDGGPPNDKVRTRGFRIVLVANEEQPALTPDAAPKPAGASRSQSALEQAAESIRRLARHSPEPPDKDLEAAINLLVTSTNNDLANRLILQLANHRINETTESIDPIRLAGFTILMTREMTSTLAFLRSVKSTVPEKEQQRIDQLIGAVERSALNQVAPQAAPVPPVAATGAIPKVRTRVATFFEEPVYQDQLEGFSTPPDRLLQLVTPRLSADYRAREKLTLKEEWLAALAKQVWRQIQEKPQAHLEETLSEEERFGMSYAWQQASMQDWLLTKSLYERYGGRVGFGSLGLWLAPDGRNALIKEAIEAGNFKILDPELEKAFWDNANKKNFADAYPTGEDLKRYLSQPPQLRD